MNMRTLARSASRTGSLRRTTSFIVGAKDNRSFASLGMTKIISIPVASAAPRLAPKKRARTWGTAEKKSQTLRMTMFFLDRFAQAAKYWKVTNVDCLDVPLRASHQGHHQFANPRAVEVHAKARDDFFRWRPSSARCLPGPTI